MFSQELNKKLDTINENKQANEEPDFDWDDI